MRPPGSRPGTPFRPRSGAVTLHSSQRSPPMSPRLLAGLCLPALLLAAPVDTGRRLQKKFKNAVGIEMVRVPGTREQFPKKGTFTMGSPKVERHRDDDEAQHEVEVSEFYLGAHEVTVGQFR